MKSFVQFLDEMRFAKNVPRGPGSTADLHSISLARVPRSLSNANLDDEQVLKKIADVLEKYILSKHVKRPGRRFRVSFSPSRSGMTILVDGVSKDDFTFEADLVKQIDRVNWDKELEGIGSADKKTVDALNKEFRAIYDMTDGMNGRENDAFVAEIAKATRTDKSDISYGITKGESRLGLDPEDDETLNLGKNLGKYLPAAKAAHKKVMG